MSDNILQAIDNIQAALATLDLADGVGTAHETLQSINTNIDAIRLSIDTRSIAEVTAQNTNFTDLITAISALACSPTVNNYITVQGGSCCSGGGCEPPVGSGTEGGDPPGDGWTDPPGAPDAPGSPGSSVYYERKCKVANAIHENVVGLISAMNDAGLTSLTYPMLLGALGFAVGFVTPIPFIDDIALAVSGFLVGLAITYYTSGADLAQLLLDLDTNEQALVCALYNSSNGNDALTAYLDVLDTYGTPAANLALLEAVVVIDLVNRLYFQKDAGEEAALESYTPPLSCTDCGCQPYVNYGTVDWSVGTHDWQSEYNPAGYYEISYCYCQLSTPTMLDVTFNSITGWTDKGPEFVDFRLHSSCPPPAQGDIYSSPDTFPTGQRHCHNMLVFWSATPFSINVTVHGEC